MPGSTYNNNDGLEVRFGSSQGNRGQKAGVTIGAGKRRELVLTIDLVALGAGGTGFTADLNNDGVAEAFANADYSGTNTSIPIGSKIVSANVTTLVTPVGGTNFSVGAFKADGTIVDVAGFLTTALAQGALVGTQVTAVQGNLYAAAKATGTYTAGKVKVVIEYLSV